MQISEILTPQYLEKFRIFHEQTLFPPNWDALKEKRCPLCGNKLKFPKGRSIAICGGKKHRKSFVINSLKLKP